MEKSLFLIDLPLGVTTASEAASFLGLTSEDVSEHILPARGHGNVYMIEINSKYNSLISRMEGVEGPMPVMSLEDSTRIMGAM